MFEIFYKTFLHTTDPHTDYNELISFNVLFSIFVHVILYTVAYFLLTRLFNLPKKFFLFITGLIVVMILGYFGRLARVKSIYNALLEETDKANAREKSMNVLRNAYFTWYYLS
jgi:uncharacterized protein YacL